MLKGYIVLQDLLFGFESPSVMDCKMGVRLVSFHVITPVTLGAENNPSLPGGQGRIHSYYVATFVFCYC